MNQPSLKLQSAIGINFDAKLVAKGTTEGSQAAAAGVGNGWRAISVGTSVANAWQLDVT